MPPGPKTRHVISWWPHRRPPRCNNPKIINERRIFAVAKVRFVRDNRCKAIIAVDVRRDVSMLRYLKLESIWASRGRKLYGNPTFGIQVTGNSNSIRAFWMPLRKAAAGARAMLVEAAAQIWKADSTSIRTETSTAIHEPSGRRLAYAALVITPPSGRVRNPTPKVAKE